MSDEYISPQQLFSQLQSAQAMAAPTVIDVRDAGAYAAGHIPGAQHIPVDELAGRLDEIPKDHPVVPY